MKWKQKRPGSGNYQGQNKNKTRLSKYSIEIGSGYVNLHYKRSSTVPRSEIPKRGKIKHFSRKSSLRLKKLLFSLQESPTEMITLTYPKYYPADSTEWKKHLDTFGKWLEREFPDSWWIWRLEPQKRGAPHFHIIGCTNVDFPDFVSKEVFYKKVARRWFEIVGTGYDEHLKAGTQVKFLDSKEQLKFYVSKYITKIQLSHYPEWASPGRFWGVIGRANLPKRFLVYMSLSRSEYMTVRRLLRRYVRSLRFRIKKTQKIIRFSKILRKLIGPFILIDSLDVFRLLNFVHPPDTRTFVYRDTSIYDYFIYGPA